MRKLLLEHLYYIKKNSNLFDLLKKVPERHHDFRDSEEDPDLADPVDYGIDEDRANEIGVQSPTTEDLLLYHHKRDQLTDKIVKDEKEKDVYDTMENIEKDTKTVEEKTIRRNPNNFNIKILEDNK